MKKKRPILKLKEPIEATGPWLDKELKRGEDRMKAILKEKKKNG